MVKHHEYPTEVVWTGGRSSGNGTITSAHSGISVPIAVPPEFGGAGKAGGSAATNPEELLTNAIAGCYTITFGLVAENRKLPIQQVKTEVVGTVEENGAKFTYTKVVIRPRIVLAPGSTDQHVEMTKLMAEKADGYCIITNAVRDRVQIIVDPEVAVAEA